MDGQGFAAIDFGTRTAQVVSPCDAVAQGRSTTRRCRRTKRSGFKEQLFTDILRLEPVEVESRNALVDELHDFVDARAAAVAAPRVTGEHGRERAWPWPQAILAIGPGRPSLDSRIVRGDASILRGPHLEIILPAAPRLHREAG